MLDANAMARIRMVRGADGLLYAHDPDFVLHWATHVHIPQHTDYLPTDGLAGLEEHEQRQTARRMARRRDRHNLHPRRQYWTQHNPKEFEPDFLHWGQLERGHTLQGLGTITPLEQGATMALNFIPGVGPFLAAGASLIESFFSGGDPTPEYKLEEEVLQLRDAIAQAHHTLGMPDSFALAGPIGGGANGDVMRKAVTEALGHPGSGPTWRADLYQAIKNLPGRVLQSISQQANNHDVVQQVLAALQQSAVLPPPASASPPDGTGSPPARPRQLQRRRRPRRHSSRRKRSNTVHGYSVARARSWWYSCLRA